MKWRSMPPGTDVAAACEELDQRRASGESVPILVRVVCHQQVIAKVWELGTARALLRADKTSEKTTTVGGGLPARPGPRRPVTEAILVDGDPGPFERARRAPTRCPRGHGVFLLPEEVRRAVTQARHQGRPTKMILTFDEKASTSVQASIT